MKPKYKYGDIVLYHWENHNAVFEVFGTIIGIAVNGTQWDNSQIFYLVKTPIYLEPYSVGESYIKGTIKDIKFKEQLTKIISD